MATEKKSRKKYPRDSSSPSAEEPAVAYAAVFKQPGFLFPAGMARPLELLGIAPSFKALKTFSENDFIAVIRDGIYKKSMDRLAAFAGLSSSEMASFVHTSDRTLRRYEDRHKLNPDQSERLIELARLYSRGEEVFGSMELFREWMDTSTPALGNQTPKSFLDTSIGIDMIGKQLLRIEHGVYS